MTLPNFDVTAADLREMLAGRRRVSKVVVQTVEPPIIDKPPPPEPEQPEFKQRFYPPTRKPRTMAGHLAVDGRKCCTGCRETQPTNNFHNRAMSLDGLQHLCKTCSKKMHRTYNSPEMVGDKQCSTCWKVKPVTDFHADKYNWGGRKGVCTVCEKKRKAEWYQRRGKQLEAARNARKREMANE